MIKDLYMDIRQKLDEILCSIFQHSGREGYEQICSRCGKTLTNNNLPLEPQRLKWESRPKLIKEWQFFWSYIIRIEG
jgi:hypothetical protein